MRDDERTVLRQIADELRAIAGFGLNFAVNNPSDAERYHYVLAASARLAALLDGQDPAQLLDHYRQNFFSIGPAASGEAAVLHEGKLLLVQRSDNGLWALPGGITDPGETLAETAQRELYEETGICGRISRFLGIFDSRLWHSDKLVHFYHALFLFEADEWEPKLNAESYAAAYFAEDALPPLSPGHHLRAPFIFKQLRGEAAVPYFDPVDENLVHEETRR
jgi:8-oxo-dGTP pyrophosphatase MutT (NUDIX family)